MEDSKAASPLSEDIIYGTQAIADEIGRSLTETQYLIRVGALPVGRLGPKLLFASRRQLRRHFNQKAGPSAATASAECNTSAEE